MDNEVCVHVLRSSEFGCGECFHLSNHCRNLFSLNCWEVRVTHCYREGNMATDKLANLGADQVASMLFFNNPTWDIVRIL